MTGMCFYLSLDDYLAQWFIHEHGGNNPVQLKRGSPESDIVELYISVPPKGHVPERGEPGQTAVLIPHFRGKDPAYYNYLPPKAAKALVNCIRVRFDVQMWEELHRFGYLGRRKADLVYAWMEKHGIADCEKNWCAITKRYQRKRNTFQQNRRRASKNPKK